MCGPGTADTSRRVNKRTYLGHQLAEVELQQATGDCARTIKSLTTDFVRNLINAG
jgi:hypothetical protein